MCRLLYYYKMHSTCCSFSLHIIYFQGLCFPHDCIAKVGMCENDHNIIIYLLYKCSKIINTIYFLKLNSKHLSNLLSSWIMRILFIIAYCIYARKLISLYKSRVQISLMTT